MRRLRATPFARALTAENTLSASDFIYPMFVLEGEGQREAVPSMPGVERLSIDLLTERAREAFELGIPAIALFPVVGEAKKSLDAAEAYSPTAWFNAQLKHSKPLCQSLELSQTLLWILTPRTVRTASLMTTVMCSMTSQRKPWLQAVSHAEAGADVVAPSDMMDGRIGAIREAREADEHVNTLILSYAAKYASVYYGPFRMQSARLAI